MTQEAEILEFEGFKFKPFTYNRNLIKLILKKINNEEPSDRVFALIESISENPTELKNRIGIDGKFDLPFLSRLTAFLSDHYFSKMYTSITLYPTYDENILDENINDSYLTKTEYKQLLKLSKEYEILPPMKLKGVLYVFRNIDNFSEGIKIFNASVQDITDYGFIPEIIKKYELTGNYEKLSKDTFEYYAFNSIVGIFLNTFETFNDVYKKKI